MSLRNGLAAAVAFMLLTVSMSASTLQFDSSVVPAESGSGYVCTASLLEIPSRSVVVVRSVHAVPGDSAMAVSGTADAQGSGTEYRLTCTVDPDANQAHVKFETTTTERGTRGQFAVYESVVALPAASRSGPRG
jgi:hypothetical protein